MNAEGEKIFLNYQGADFRRSLIYLGLGCLTIFAGAYIKFNPPIPPPGAVAGPSLAKILLIFIGILLILSAFFDALFVFFQKYLRGKQFAFDQVNFYIIQKHSTSKIPLKNIIQISLASTRRQNSIRGFSSDYRISYQEARGEKDFLITIYSRMRNNFENFKQIAQVNNPSIKIKNWATNFDGLARLIKKIKK